MSIFPAKTPPARRKFRSTARAAAGSSHGPTEFWEPDNVRRVVCEIGQNTIWGLRFSSERKIAK
jgi:hypothetical protein